MLFSLWHKITLFIASSTYFLQHPTLSLSVSLTLSLPSSLKVYLKFHFTNSRIKFNFIFYFFSFLLFCWMKGEPCQFSQQLILITFPRAPFYERFHNQWDIFFFFFTKNGNVIRKNDDNMKWENNKMLSKQRKCLNH